MKKNLFCIYAAVIFVASFSRVYAVGEKVLSIGAGSGWEAMETRSGLAEISSVRPHPVLALSSARPDGGAQDPALSGSSGEMDLSISFDEGGSGRFFDKTGRWQVFAADGAGAAGISAARTGTGAARFYAGNSPQKNEAAAAGVLSARPGQSSIFSSGKRAGDFSIEFWIFPLNLGNGEQILLWSSSKADGRGGYVTQNIQCMVSKNRLLWDFTNFFTDPADLNAMDISFSGSVVMPREWSHHLVRFDSALGLLEYLVDGRLEALDYVTSSGMEGGEVYTPLMGGGGRLVVGRRFSGLMDELCIHGRYVENPAVEKFPSRGRTETRTIDLGSPLSRVLKLEAFGGRTTGAGTNPVNFFAGGGNLKFEDHSEIQLFVRVNGAPYGWENIPWIPVKAGTELADIKGRYFQAAADFYPSGDGEITPYLDELRVVYIGAEPPRPPSMVTAHSIDGGVELSWRPGPSASTAGYLVYFGESGGEYFGEYALTNMKEVKSPVSAGNITSMRIDGLRNGTLYYFAVAAYNEAGEEGEFSAETAARPLGGRAAALGEVSAGDWRVRK